MIFSLETLTLGGESTPELLDSPGTILKEEPLEEGVQTWRRDH